MHTPCLGTRKTAAYLSYYSSTEDTWSFPVFTFSDFDSGSSACGTAVLHYYSLLLHSVTIYDRVWYSSMCLAMVVVGW